jgi:eukaryotic-like serine/threonine-protein kinase
MRIKPDPERWHRLKEILADALDQSSPEERMALLRQACTNDATLFREAQQLLAHDTTIFDKFAEFAATRLRENENGRLGERLGAYAVVRELGRGGMGAVYLAERADGQFEKRVAIKVLKRGTDTDEVLRRFRIERQILAELEHPNITRLLDAGTTTDGLPYFVMEFVEGTPITQFVQREKVDLRGRLKLFLKVCSAVELAHRYRIIHRDIKPGNVFVNGNGDPKLLDFGIAKVLSVDSDDDITTVVAERRLTPVYAAPEQNEGQSATIATDVYSLGAFLYELLTDKPPFAEAVVSGRVSEAAANSGMERQLRGQLDQIVARAMQRDPAQRYSSVAGMCEDIERCLNGVMPLSENFSTAASHAGSGSGKSRVGTRSRRRAYIAAAVLGVIVLAAALLSPGPGVRWLHNQKIGHPTPVASPVIVTDAVRSIAVLPFEPLGRDANDELLGLGMADAIIGRMSALKQLAVLPTSAVSRYKGPANDPITAGRALGADAILSGTVQRSGDRVRTTVQLVHIATRHTIWSEKFDQTFTDIFEIQDSISDSVARSLALNLTAAEQKQLVRRYTTNAAAYDEYLMGLHFWDMRSREGFEKAIDYFQRAVEKDPKFALAYAMMADCHYLQFYYGYDRRPDRIENAKAAAERALLLDDSIAEAHVAIAMIQFNQRDNDKAMASLRHALALNPNLAIAHQRYAWALAAFGHLDESVREMRYAQKLDPLSHTNNTALGISLIFARQYREALDYCYKAAELAPNLAPVQGNLGFAYMFNGRFDQAIQLYQKAGELDPDGKGDALTSIATVLVYAGRKSEADSMMPEILRLAAADKVDPYGLAVLYGLRGELDPAFEWLDKALQKGAERQTNGHDSRMIRYDPLLDPLRSDDRFAAILRKHNRGSLRETANSSTVRSIAVLPFEPLGKDMDDELLGLGMADAVIGKLSTLKQLVVLPTCAVSRYKGPASNPLVAGRTLQVDAILSGTVQRSGDRVRATVQLMRVGSGRMIWSEKFDQTFTDVFNIQDAISESVARSLALNLTVDERERLAKRYTTNAGAYDEYLMGLYFWNTRSKEGLEKAITHFGRAVEKDPNFALAYALMSDCYYLQLTYGYDSRSDRIQNAKAAAERALLLDDSIAEAHVAMAMVQFYQKDDRLAESDHQVEMDSLRRAIALNPNLAIAHQRYAWALAAFGHLDDAVREMRGAQELDPLSHVNNTGLGIILVFARQYHEALEYCYKAAELAPNQVPAQSSLAFAYFLNGRYQQAIDRYRKVRELNPNDKGNILASIATVLTSAGRKSDADSMMREILKLAGEGKADPYYIVALYAVRGEKDAAFEWFARALQKGPETRSNGNESRAIRYDPLLDPLRADNRFAELLRQYNRDTLLEAAAVP